MNRLLLHTLFWSIAFVGLARATNPLADTVFVQRYDTLCQGDTLKIFGQKYTQPGRYRYNLPPIKPTRDTSVIINLHLKPKFQTQRFDTLCQGDQMMVGKQIFSSPGAHQVVFPATKLRCDSTVKLKLTVLPIYTQTVKLTLCEGDTMALGAERYYAQALTTLRYVSKAGCDSIVQYQIDMLDTFRTRIDTVVCKGSKVKVGNEQMTAIQDGTFRYNFAPTSLRCDSLIELKLRVRDTFLTQVQERFCEGSSRQLGTVFLTQSGMYRYTFPPNDRRCDSTVILDLRVLQPQEITTQVEICNGETLRIGQEQFNRTGTYRISLRTREGCDSVINLSLRVRPKLGNNISASICAGEQFRFGKRILNQTGIYIDTLSSRISGCDSIVRLDLQVARFEQSVLNRSICKGESYSFDGKDLRTPGIYFDTIRNPNLCPIVIELRLTVNPIFSDTVRATICQGTTYAFGRNNLSRPGFYSFRLTSAQGCDSVQYLQLKVLPSYLDSLTAPICVGDTFRYGQLKFFKEGRYPIRLSTRLGCDSTLLLKIVHYPVQRDTFPVSLCAGDTFRLGRLKYFQTGLYPISLRDRNACDSTLYIQVTRHPRYQLNAAQALCGGRSIRFGSQTINRSGTYIETFRSKAGCDSVVTLRLNMEQIDTSVTQGGILLSASTNAGIRRYEWIDCGSKQVVYRLSSPFFLPERSGSYAVRIYTDTCVYTSGCHSVQLSTAASRVDISNQIQIAPNPTAGNLTLTLPTPLQGQYFLSWYNSAGQQLRHEKTWLSGTTDLDLAGFPAGLYLLHLQTNDGKKMAMMKILKFQ